jgi:hypothetical protein
MASIHYQGAFHPDNGITGAMYAAIHGNFGAAPSWFKHIVTDGQPPQPDISGLSGDDQAEVNEWKGNVARGITNAGKRASYSSEAKDAIDDFIAYYEQADYLNWLADDRISREMQWRLRCASILFKLLDIRTTPISADSGGAGTNAPNAPIVMWP